MRREHELHGRRRGRNWAVLGALVALAVLLFAVTIVKLGPDAGNPASGGSWGTALVEWLRGGETVAPGAPAPDTTAAPAEGGQGATQ